MKIYDVIIVGAGPVGLMYAIRLSKKYKIALIDSKKIPTFKKSWYIPRLWAEKTGLNPYITNIISRIGLRSLNHKDIQREIPKPYHFVCIDEKKFFINELQNITANGVKIFGKNPITRFKIFSDYVEVSNKKKALQAKLILDCSGVDSIFIKRGSNFKHEFYWSTYGLLFNGGNTDWNLAYAGVHVGYHEGYKIFIDDVPEGKGCYTPWLFIMAPHRIPLSTMRSLYKKILKGEFLRKRIQGFKPIQEKFGWIPAWDLKSRTSDRILSLGDAGGLAPFQNAMTFSFALHTLEEFTSRIIKCLDSDDLSREHLQKVTKLTSLQKFNFDIGKIFFCFLMNLNADEFERCFKVYKKVNILDFLSFLLYMDIERKGVQRIVMQFLKEFTIKELLEIFGRDGYIDEIKIGPELAIDFIKRIIANED